MKTVTTVIACLCLINMQAQKVGINTSMPKAMLHVKDSSVVFEGSLLTNALYAGTTPVAGAGVKMMWFAPYGAFRCGMVEGFGADAWDKQNIGEMSFASGNTTVASGIASAAFGSYSEARGGISFAAGYSCFAQGQHSFAAGSLSQATGSYTAAFNSSRATNAYAFSGNVSRAAGMYSSSWGNGTIAGARNSFVAGEWNDTSNMTSQGSMVASDAIFQVGIGSNNINRKNAINILRNGTIGIGVNNPAALIHAKANSTIVIPQLLLEEEGNDFARLGFKNSNTTNAWHIAASPAAINSTSYMNFYWQGTGANVLILKGDGNAILQGTLTQNSDERLKKNVSRITDPLSMLKALNGYHYQWKEEGRDQSLQTGLLAQEVEAIMPELVKEDAQGIKSVNYMGLIPYLLESIKSLKRELDDSKMHEAETLRMLQQEIEKLKALK